LRQLQEHAGICLVGNTHLLTKVYFPRLHVPLAAVLAGIVDFGVSLVILIGMMLWYGIVPGWPIMLLPLFVILALLSALAVGLWLAALNVQYRDVQHVLPFLVQAWMFGSPVAYSAKLIPAGYWQVVYGLNPMTGVIQGFRWALIGGPPPDLLLMSASVGMVLFLLVSGVLYFKRMEKTFADVV
jgi:lipopolysaccharide transport system permease protein